MAGLPEESEGTGVDMDPTLEGAGKELLSSGVLGAVVLGLVYFILLLRREMTDLRLAHKVEIAEKDKLILELQEARLAEAKIGFDVAKSTESTLDAFLLAIRGNKSS